MTNRSQFDVAWHESALRGELDAIRALAEGMLEPLYQFCLYRVGGRSHLCEEAVQSALVQAMQQLEHYDPGRCGSNIFPWLTGLARNEIRRILKREKATLSLDQLWQTMDQHLLSLFARLEAEPIAEEALLRAETREMVNVTMSQLPPHYREALEGKYVSGLSVEVLAQQHNTSMKAMESLLGRARKAFRSTFLALCKALEVEPTSV